MANKETGQAPRTNLTPVKPGGDNHPSTSPLGVVTIAPPKAVPQKDTAIQQKRKETALDPEIQQLIADHEKIVPSEVKKIVRDTKINIEQYAKAIVGDLGKLGNDRLAVITTNMGAIRDETVKRLHEDGVLRTQGLEGVIKDSMATLQGANQAGLKIIQDQIAALASKKSETAVLAGPSRDVVGVLLRMAHLAYQVHPDEASRLWGEFKMSTGYIPDQSDVGYIKDVFSHDPAFDKGCDCHKVEDKSMETQSNLYPEIPDYQEDSTSLSSLRKRKNRQKASKARAPSLLHSGSEDEDEDTQSFDSDESISQRRRGKSNSRSRRPSRPAARYEFSGVPTISLAVHSRDPPPSFVPTITPMGSLWED